VTSSPSFLLQTSDVPDGECYARRKRRGQEQHRTRRTSILLFRDPSAVSGRRRIRIRNRCECLAARRYPQTSPRAQSPYTAACRETSPCWHQPTTCGSSPEAARYIVHADKPEGAGDLRSFLVQEVLSAVRDRGVDSLRAALLSGPLGASECGLVLGEHPGILDLGAGRECRALLAAGITPRHSCLGASVRIWPQDCNTNARARLGRTNQT
jgi:hypothetical protein